jgi:hypothetical protein
MCTHARTHACLAASLTLLAILHGGCTEQSARVGQKKAALYSQWYPATCSSSAYTSVPAALSIDRWQPIHWPTLPTRNYARRTNTPWWALLFNQNVRDISFQFDGFATGSIFDSLKLLHAGGTTKWWTLNVPPSVAGPYSINPHLGATYAHLQWHTDDLGVGLGYDIPEVRVRCTDWPSTPGIEVYAHPNQPYDGFLLATNDVIWVYTLQRANRELSIYLDPVDDGVSANADFDLLVSVDPSSRLPPISSMPPGSQISNLGGATPEMVLLPAPSVDRYVYVAIGSYSGSGRFRFYANEIEPNHQDTIHVYTDFTPQPHHRQAIRNSLRKLAAAIYFSTDGRHLIREFEVTYNFSGTRQDPSMVYLGQNKDGRCYCFGGAHSWCNSVYPTNPFTYISYRANHWCGCEPSINPTCSCTDTDAFHEQFATNAGIHEYGHCFLGLPDEDPAQHPDGHSCGHSMMNAGRIGGNVQNKVDLCTERNAGYDPDPGTTGHSSSESGWACVQSSYSSTPAVSAQNSPDPYWQTGRVALSDYPFNRYLTITETN